MGTIEGISNHILRTTQCVKILDEGFHILSFIDINHQV